MHSLKLIISNDICSSLKNLSNSNLPNFGKNTCLNFTRGSRPALPGIQNNQHFFVNLQPWRHLTNFEAHLKSVKKFEIWPRKLKFFFPSAFLMEGMNSKMTKPITIPISSVFERYINHCSGCPECRVYPGHNRDLISSRDYPVFIVKTKREIYQQIKE